MLQYSQKMGVFGMGEQAGHDPRAGEGSSEGRSREEILADIEAMGQDEFKRRVRRGFGIEDPEEAAHLEASRQERAARRREKMEETRARITELGVTDEEWTAYSATHPGILREKPPAEHEPGKPIEADTGLWHDSWAIRDDQRRMDLWAARARLDGLEADDYIEALPEWNERNVLDVPLMARLADEHEALQRGDESVYRATSPSLNYRRRSAAEARENEPELFAQWPLTKEQQREREQRNLEYARARMAELDRRSAAREAKPVDGGRPEPLGGDAVVDTRPRPMPEPHRPVHSARPRRTVGGDMDWSYAPPTEPALRRPAAEEARPAHEEVRPVPRLEGRSESPSAQVDYPAQEPLPEVNRWDDLLLEEVWLEQDDDQG